MTSTSMDEKGIVTNIAEYCGSGDQSVRLILSLLSTLDHPFLMLQKAYIKCNL